MKKFIAFAVALLSVLGATAQPFLTTKGGVYQKVSSYTKLKDNDIVIAASHSMAGGTDKVYVMTTALASTTDAGKFGYYIYGVYESDMPKTITLSDVNNGEYPYEYAVKFNSKHPSNGYYVSLQNKEGKYINYDTNSTTSICLSEDIMYWQVGGNQEYMIYAGKDKTLRCSNSVGYFTDIVGGASKPAYLYRKTYQLSIGAEGYATLYYGSNDVVLPAGVKAYTYEINGDKLLPAVTYDGDNGDILPHATAVIVKGTPNMVYTLDVKNTQKTSGSSVLRGSDDAVSTKLDGDAEGSRYYMFGKGSNGLGFYYGNNDGKPFKNKEHKAYLCLNASLAAKGFTLVLPDGTNIPTGVGGVAGAPDASADVKSDVWYDLSGKQVKRNAKGLFIHKGKVVAY